MWVRGRRPRTHFSSRPRVEVEIVEVEVVGAKAEAVEVGVEVEAVEAEVAEVEVQDAEAEAEIWATPGLAFLYLTDPGFAVLFPNRCGSSPRKQNRSRTGVRINEKSI